MKVTLIYLPVCEIYCIYWQIFTFGGERKKKKRKRKKKERKEKRKEKEEEKKRFPHETIHSL